MGTSPVWDAGHWRSAAQARWDAAQTDAAAGTDDVLDLERNQDMSDGSMYDYEHMRTHADAYMSTPKTIRFQKSFLVFNLSSLYLSRVFSGFCFFLVSRRKVNSRGT